jgi:hypothetical protein
VTSSAAGWLRAGIEQQCKEAMELVLTNAYFHGWYLAQAMLNGYTRDARTRKQLLADARQFAPLIALHHASRSVTLRRPQRLQYAIQFLHLAWPQ